MMKLNLISLFGVLGFLASSLASHSALSEGSVILDAACTVNCRVGQTLVSSHDEDSGQKYQDVKKTIYYDIIAKTRKQIDEQVVKACSKFVSADAEYLASDCVLVKH